MQILFSDSMESSKDPEREKFCLKWNEYENNISATFKALRGDDDFADVTLVSDENLQLEVHKIILAASSPFFRLPAAIVVRTAIGVVDPTAQEH